MGHDLADGKDQIEAALGEQPVDLRGPGIVQLALELLVNELRRNLADRFHIGSPVVNAEEILRHIAEHMGDLVRPHGSVRAQGGKNRLEPVAIILPGVAGQRTGAGMLAALIGGYGQHVVAHAEFGQALCKQLFQLLRR